MRWNIAAQEFRSQAREGPSAFAFMVGAEAVRAVPGGYVDPKDGTQKVYNEVLSLMRELNCTFTPQGLEAKGNAFAAALVGRCRLTLSNPS